MSTATILWLICCWIPLPIWWSLRNDARFKKNIVVGVTFPREARDDEQVASILNRYRRHQALCSLALTAGALIAAAAGSVRAFAAPLMAIWSFWILAAIIIPEAIFARTNQKLAALKSARGWRREREGSPARVTVANVSAAAQAYPRVSGAWFFLAGAAALAPAIFDRSNTPLYLLFFASDLMMGAIFRWCYRDRSETVDDDAALAQTLTRIRRRAWARVSLVAAFVFAAFSWIFLCLQTSPPLYFISVMFLTVALVIMAFATEMRVRGLQERLTQASGKGFYVDEDDRWIFGLFYCNPDDTNLIANSRVGINTTFNLARPAGKAIFAIIVVLLLSIPAVGVFMADEFGTPVTLELSGHSLAARHSLTRYTVDLSQASSVELIDELPPMTRTFGGASETFLTGDFSSAQYGKLKVCLDPSAGPWLLVRMNDGAGYLLGASDAAVAKTVFATVGSGPAMLPQEM